MTLAGHCVNQSVVAVINAENLTALADDEVGLGVSITRAVELGNDLLDIVLCRLDKLLAEAGVYLVDTGDIFAQCGYCACGIIDGFAEAGQDQVGRGGPY